MRIQQRIIGCYLERILKVYLTKTATRCRSCITRYNFLRLPSTTLIPVFPLQGRKKIYIRRGTHRAELKSQEYSRVVSSHLATFLSFVLLLSSVVASNEGRIREPSRTLDETAGRNLRSSPIFVFFFFSAPLRIESRVSPRD